ncbi:MAG: hypothetical protein IJY87_04605 [Bacilli bacterium]|nr:hypothetical protein [Bacilli bacterium]
MDITLFYTDIMAVITPIIVLSGFIALTISLIVMLINMLINAFSGKGIRIG